MVAANKRKSTSAGEMTVADLASLIQANDKGLRALVATLATKAEIATLATKAEIATLATKAEVMDLAAKTDEGFASLEASVNRSFTQITRESAELRAEIAERFQSIEMKILGVNNRIDILIDRTPSREEFGRLEGRVATLELRRPR